MCGHGVFLTTGDSLLTGWYWFGELLRQGAQYILCLSLQPGQHFLAETPTLERTGISWTLQLAPRTKECVLMLWCCWMYIQYVHCRYRTGSVRLDSLTLILNAIEDIVNRHRARNRGDTRRKNWSKRLLVRNYQTFEITDLSVSTQYEHHWKCRRLEVTVVRDYSVQQNDWTDDGNYFRIAIIHLHTYNFLKVRCNHSRLYHKCKLYEECCT